MSKNWRSCAARATITSPRMTPAAVTSISRAASAWAAAFRRRDVRIVLAAAARSAGVRLLFGCALATGGCHLFESRAPLHPEAPAGSWHVVGPGESLEEIARRADVPMADLVEING